jgi:undecaprenyl-diphosphatase
VLVCAVGASRVYLGVHYPTDVAAGIILGLAWAAGVIRWST